MEPAVDADHLSGDPRRRGVGQRHDPARDIVGLAAPSEWDRAPFLLFDRLDRLGGKP
jgi:hypothetical protein